MFVIPLYLLIPVKLGLRPFIIYSYVIQAVIWICNYDRLAHLLFNTKHFKIFLICAEHCMWFANLMSITFQDYCILSTLYRRMKWWWMETWLIISFRYCFRKDRTMDHMQKRLTKNHCRLKVHAEEFNYIIKVPYTFLIKTNIVHIQHICSFCWLFSVKLSNECEITKQFRILMHKGRNADEPFICILFPVGLDETKNFINICKSLKICWSLKTLWTNGWWIWVCGTC